MNRFIDKDLIIIIGLTILTGIPVILAIAFIVTMVGGGDSSPPSNTPATVVTMPPFPTPVSTDFTPKQPITTDTQAVNP